MRKGVVDSFEDNGELVVIELEDKTTIAVPKDKFICEVHVNDVVYETESVCGRWTKRRQKASLKRCKTSWMNFGRKKSDAGK